MIASQRTKFVQGPSVLAHPFRMSSVRLSIFYSSVFAPAESTLLTAVPFPYILPGKMVKLFADLTLHVCIQPSRYVASSESSFSGSKELCHYGMLVRWIRVEICAAEKPKAPHVVFRSLCPIKHQKRPSKLDLPVRITSPEKVFLEDSAQGQCLWHITCFNASGTESS
jgi:hypothetical protein